MSRHIELLQWVRTRKGVAHTSTARAAGFGKADVARAVELGMLRRIRRSWLVAPEADARRAAAAAVSGRTTCVTQAALIGLWVPPHEGIHIAVAGNAARFDTTGLVVHWGAGPAPVASTANEDPLVNVLFHVARCLPRGEAMAVWESALRARLADPHVLEAVEWRSPVARELADAASLLSDSGLETRFITGMRSLGIAVRQQVWLEGHPVDVLIGERLVVQLDGFEHHRAADRRRDIAHDARLRLRGYTVLRFDFHQVLFDWAYVEETVVLAIAQGLHLAHR
jgi:very-short-patch-repair endonuclease